MKADNDRHEENMDLRRRLVGTLALLLGCLLAMTAVVQLLSLRSDIEAEVEASARLVNVLLAAGDAGGAGPALEARLAHAGLRHLSIRTADQPAPPRTPPPLLARLGLAPAERGEQAIRVGARTLVVAPNPRSEFEERVADTVQIWSILLFFSATTLLLTWWCADRALAPVRELEASLHRLARGEPDPALPAFALREFGRVARAIEHLAGALADARAAQHALARQLIAVQEEERRTLARELHDDMGQTLTALSVTATHLARNAARMAPAALVDCVAECAADLRRDLRTCGDQLRTMLAALRPHGLDAGSLAPTLRELVQGWRGRHTEIAFALALPQPMPDIDDAMALTLYRVVQEALTNVVRHSGARHCAVRLTTDGAGLVLDIVDDGAGLADGPPGRGGLLGMQERVGMAGGRLDVLDNPSGGLHLRARLPLAAATPASCSATAGALP